MKLIVGLGNPGVKYEKTRHNIGFMVVENFLRDFEKVEKTNWDYNAKLKSDIAIIEWQTRLDSRQREAGQKIMEKVILAKPRTFMNNSGLAVSLLLKYYKTKVDDLLVVYDDIDLDLGKTRIRFAGASGGHNGATSIIESLKTDKFWRLRIGIGRPKKYASLKLKMKHKDIENFVLSTFPGAEWGKAREVIKRGSLAIEAVLEEGFEKAMNRFNSR